MKELLNLIPKNPTRRECVCALCEDTYQIPVWMVGEKKYVGWAEYTAAGFPNADSQILIPCEDCLDKRQKGALALLQIKRGDRIVNLELVREVLGECRLSEIAKKVPTLSVLITGPSRIGKSLVMEYWYNRVMREQGLVGLMWETENSLFLKFRNDDTTEEVLDRAARAKFFFIDDVFRPDNWPEDGGRGHYHKVERSGYFELFDIFSKRREGCVVVASSNRDPAASFLLNGPLLGRMNEIFRNRVEL